MFWNRDNPNKSDQTVNQKPDLPVYQIGFTEQNKICMTIGNSPYTATMYMNEGGVRQLIAVLESTIPMFNPDEEVDNELDIDDHSDSVDGC